MTLQKNHIASQLEQAEKKASQNPSNQAGGELYIKILSHGGDWKVDGGRTNAEVFEELTKTINTNTEGKNYGVSPHFGSKAWFSIAASIVLLIAATFFINNAVSTVSEVSNVTELKHIYLPDGSKVALNAASDISYDKRDWEKGIRDLELSGQAYFEVKKGSRFTVNTEHGSVEVLGTSFNVYDREDGFHVECFTGKVKVKTRETNSEVLLTRGLHTTLEANKVPTLEKATTFEVEKQKEWVQGVFNFYNAPIRTVFDELERQFDVKVELKNEEKRHYTGTFNKKNLDKALANICKPMGLRFEIQDNKQVLIIN